MGEFYQTPGCHLDGCGCHPCGREKQGPGTAQGDRRPLTTQSFIAVAVSKHSDVYIYDKVEYTDARSKAIIDCVQHGQFYMTPANRLQGQGCAECALEARRGIYIYLREYL